MNRIVKRIITASYDDIDSPVFFMKPGEEDELFKGFQDLLNEPKPIKDDSFYGSKKDNNERILWIANKYNATVKKLYFLCKNQGMRMDDAINAKGRMNRYDNYINNLKDVYTSKLTDAAQKAYELLPLYKEFNQAVGERPSEMGLGGLEILDSAFCKGIEERYGQPTVTLNFQKAKEDFIKQKQKGTTQAKNVKEFIRQFEKVEFNNQGTSKNRNRGKQNIVRR